MNFIFDINAAKLYDSWYHSAHGKALEKLVNRSLLTLLDPQPGERVLDIGCGAGVDTIVAAMVVGPTGRAVGVDMTPEMLVRARESVQLIPLENVSFEEASAENLPFENASFDVIISNGVFNLVANKQRALAEAFRILKSNGRFMVADQILVGQLPTEKRARIKSWFQ